MNADERGWCLGFVRFACVLIATLLPTLAHARQPNVLLIVSDDQGYHDLGCYGSDEVKTPQLDRLARGGVRLTNFYVTWPACTPSRGSLLTGRYPQRNGIVDMIRNEAPDYGHLYTPAEYAVSFERIGGMDLKEVLISDVMSRAGYRCGIVGKWDLGSLQRFLPTSRGFNSFYGFVNTGIDYYTHERYGVPSMYRDLKLTEEDKGTYCTDVFHREAANFIEANHDRPFFLYVPYNAPHSASNLDTRIRGAAQGPPEFKKLYPALLPHDEEYDKRMNAKYGRETEWPSKENRRLEYVSAVSAMDASIGKLLDLLDKHGIADDTLVIFLSDNGGSGGSDNSPLRGHKGQMWEGGNRVPCIVRFPGRIKPGQTSDALLTSLEVMPTILKAAGVNLQGVKLDGHDMMPTLAEGKPSPRTDMYWQRRDECAARVGDFKWIKTSKGEWLFDLSSDIGEKNDLAATQPQRLEMMRSKFAAWRADMDASPPRGPFRNY
ncbi:MAG: sulfatase-like hydrolase/transferase [Phycisphaera sp.]|nr:sulfatase-like hydrolase/transferase [Phycisphaera sp.]